MRKRYWMVLICIFAVAIVINWIAWNSTAFCDSYVAEIFPIWLNTYGRLTSCFPFSVGEIMIVVGIVLLAVAAVLGFFAAILYGRDFLYRQPAFHLPRFSELSPLAGNVCMAAKKYYSFLAYVLAGVALIMSLNCFPLYHCSTFEEKYMGTYDKDYSFEELASPDMLECKLVFATYSTVIVAP